MFQRDARSIPDEPVYGSEHNGCVKSNGQTSNSLKDWVRKLTKEMDPSQWKVQPEYDGLG